MEINNVITWKNGNAGTNSTPLSATNLNRVNTGTEEALNSLETQINSKVSEVEGEIVKAIEDAESVKEGMVAAKEASETSLNTSKTTQKMLGGYYLKVVDAKPSSPEANTIYFITGV